MTTEPWLSGPVPGIPPMLQPAAHTLLQIRAELPELLSALTPEQFWARPGASAPIGYHAAHAAGSLERLYTYARGESLSETQRAALDAERRIAEVRPPTETIVSMLTSALDSAISQLRRTNPEELFEPREVGRARLPSTVMGLLFHGAEHTIRHAGQIATLVKVLGSPGQGP